MEGKYIKCGICGKKGIYAYLTFYERPDDEQEEFYEQKPCKYCKKKKMIKK